MTDPTGIHRIDRKTGGTDHACQLCGFLKNQRYYEPLVVLLFLEGGFPFTQIGILVVVLYMRWYYPARMDFVVLCVMQNLWSRSRSQV